MYCEESLAIALSLIFGVLLCLFVYVIYAMCLHRTVIYRRLLHAEAFRVLEYHRIHRPDVVQWHEQRYPPPADELANDMDEVETSHKKSDKKDNNDDDDSLDAI